MNTIDKPYLRELHHRSWSSARLWLAFLAALFIVEGLLCWSLLQGPVWLTVVLMLLVVHLFHSHLVAFHEAVHRLLIPNRFLNDWAGMTIGTVGYLPLNAFRGMHRTHHVHLASERDEELWPFVIPGTPRWQRCLAAAFELCLGIVYTPYLCWRSFFRKDSCIRGRARTKVWCEGALNLIWTGVVIAGMFAGFGKFILVMYVIPGILAGNFHSWRKYIEHMGLVGNSPLGATRSVIPNTRLGRFITYTMWNVSYHGIHHRYAAIPQERFPELTKWLTPTTDEEVAPFPNYRQPFFAMLRSLSDPRIGGQWLRDEAPSEPRPSQSAATPLAHAHGAE